jgi:hypothetical protein
LRWRSDGWISVFYVTEFDYLFRRGDVFEGDFLEGGLAGGGSETEIIELFILHRIIL